MILCIMIIIILFIYVLQIFFFWGGVGALKFDSVEPLNP